MNRKRILLGCCLALVGVFLPVAAEGAVRITPATGGEAIPANTAGNGGSGAYTALDGPRIREGESGDIARGPLGGSLILRLPEGFEFREAPVSITATSALQSTNTFRMSHADSCPGGGSNSISVTPSDDTLTFFICNASGTAHKDTVRFEGVAVRPENLAPLRSGDICLDAASGGSIAGVNSCGTPNATSFGRVAMTGTAYTGLHITPDQSSVTSGFAKAYKAYLTDAGGNDAVDVTDATAFSIGPDGACAGSGCTPARPGAHTVTGSYSDFADTAALDAALPADSGAGGFTVEVDESLVGVYLQQAGQADDIYQFLNDPNMPMSHLTVSGTPTCNGSPDGVGNVLLFVGTNMYEMTADGAEYRHTIDAGFVPGGEIGVYFTCPTAGFYVGLGTSYVFTDPTGLITKYVPITNFAASSSAASASSPSDASFGLVPIEGATTTLYKVDGFEPAETADGNHCQLGNPEQRRPTGTTLTEVVPVENGIPQIFPPVNPTLTPSTGFYAWLTGKGCFVVVAEKPGFHPQESFMVGIDEGWAVTDLDMTLEPILGELTIDQPTEGEVYVDGRPVTALAGTPLAPQAGVVKVVGDLQVQATFDPDFVGTFALVEKTGESEQVVGSFSYDAALGKWTATYTATGPGEHTLIARATTPGGTSVSDSVAVIALL